MRRRSGSITPTYSTDRDLLLASYPGGKAVASIDEVKTAVSKLAIFDDATFQRKVPLTTIEEWTEFASTCHDEAEPEKYNLEKCLKKCYSAAYSMPASPKSLLIRPQKSKEETMSSPRPLAI